MVKNFNSLPYYHDAPRCRNCGRVLNGEEKLVHLEIEHDYSRRINGKCSGCGHGYDFVSKIFIGANGETYIGSFDNAGMVITTSGLLTTNGEWDFKLIVRENKAKNFDLETEIFNHKKKAVE